MNDSLDTDQSTLKGEIREAYKSVSLSEGQRSALHELILESPTLQKSTPSHTSTHLTVDILRKAHNWGLGYLAAMALFGFTYFGPWEVGSDQSGVHDSYQMSTTFQPNRLTRILPADFDLEGDYEGLPRVVREVMGDKFKQSPHYEVKVPRKIKGQFFPGEGRFFETEKDHLGVAVSLQPQGKRMGFRPKTLFVLPREASGTEVNQVLNNQSNLAVSERLKKAVKWGRLINDPQSKSIDELVEESNSEMIENLDVRNGAASWNSGQFRYVLYDE